MFWDGAFNWLAMVLITLTKYEQDPLKIWIKLYLSVMRVCIEVQKGASGIILDHSAIGTGPQLNTNIVKKKQWQCEDVFEGNAVSSI